MIVSAGHFAIEYELIDVEREPLRVAYRFRAGDQILGHADVVSNLDGTKDELAQLLRHAGNRRDDLLASKPCKEVFEQVRTGLMVDFDPSLDPAKDWERHSRFIALPSSSAAFDGWTAFLVEDGEVARFVWRAPAQPHVVSECVFARGDFEAVLRAFQAELAAHSNGRRTVPPISGQRAKLPVRGTG